MSTKKTQLRSFFSENCRVYLRKVCENIFCFMRWPCAQTRKILEETDKGVELIECKDADDLFSKLGI